MRLFVGVSPSEAVRRSLWGMERPELDGVRWSSEAQWHVTLRFLGDVDSAEPAIAAVRQACSGVPPAVASLGRASVRLGGVVAVAVTGLEEVADAVVSSTAEIGRPPDDRPFRGHITIARLRRGRPVPGRLVGLPVGDARTVTWFVDQVQVIQSHLGSSVRYETLASIPLSSPSLL